MSFIDDIPRGMFIGGRWRDKSKTHPIVDPSRNARIAQIAESDESDVDDAVQAAGSAFAEYRRIPPFQRGQILHNIARILMSATEELAELISIDAGKPLRQARRDVLSAAQHFMFFGGAVDKVGGRELPLDDDHVAFTRWEPRGVTGHITPWNSPLAIPARSIAAALAMGNTVVVKPSELAPLAVLALARIVEESDLPRGVLNVVPGLGPVAGSALAGHQGVACITFTGSVSTGSAVMAAAATNVTDVSLELGGKAAQVVFADASIDEALAGCVFGIVRNAGQSCLAGSRVLVEESLYEAFTSRLVDRLSSIDIGPGLEDPDMGPLISEHHMERVLGVLSATSGTVLCGGGRRHLAEPWSEGFFVEPAVVVDVDSEDELASRELFGPALTVTPFGDEAEAVRRANDTMYGLSAGVWTRDLGRAHRVANELRVGSVSVNEYPVRFYNGPHGGYKRSGIGREQGLEALRHYVEIKKIGIRVRRPT